MKRLLGHCWIFQAPRLGSLACVIQPAGRFFFVPGHLMISNSFSLTLACLLAWLWLWLLWQISCAFGDSGFEDGLWQAKGEYRLSLYVDEKGSEVLFGRTAPYTLHAL